MHNFREYYLRKAGNSVTNLVINLKSDDGSRATFLQFIIVYEDRDAMIAIINTYDNYSFFVEGFHDRGGFTFQDLGF